MAGQHSSTTSPLVLLVEDHDDTREMYGDYLKFEGFRVLSARTAEQAIEAALAEHPAVIVMDVGLPTMAGTQGENVPSSKVHGLTTRMPSYASWP